MSEEPKQKFFQFPLALFSFGADQNDRMNAIVAYATISAGHHRAATFENAEAIREYLAPRIAATGFSISNSNHRAWALGKELTNYAHTNPRHACDLYEKVETFLCYKKSPLVRIPTDLVIEFFDGTFEYDLLTTLAAVFAIIGDKKYSVVRRDRVRAGALGYSSASVLFDKEGKITTEGEAVLKGRPDKARPMTLDQCRYRLSKLHERKFFSRIQPVKSGRKVVYSRSMNHEQLADVLIKRIENKASIETAQDAAQRKLREKTDFLLKRGISGESPEKPIFLPAQSPHVPQNTPAPFPASVPAGVPALISASSHKCFSNSCPPNECMSNEIFSHGELDSESEKPSEKQPEVKAEPPPMPAGLAEIEEFSATFHKHWNGYATDFWGMVQRGEVPATGARPIPNTPKNGTAKSDSQK